MKILLPRVTLDTSQKVPIDIEWWFNDGSGARHIKPSLIVRSTRPAVASIDVQPDCRFYIIGETPGTCLVNVTMPDYPKRWRIRVCVTKVEKLSFRRKR